MTHYARRVDGNQRAIVAAVTAAGWQVHYCYMFGGGIPDLVAYRDGLRIWLEVKLPGEKLTKREREFADIWGPGPMLVVYSAEDALRKLGTCAQPA
jgi:hypothetical protein